MRVRTESLAWLFVMAAVAPAWGQGSPANLLRARLGATVLVSDNLGPTATGAADRGAVLTLTPGLSLARRSAQTQLNVDYGLSLLAPWRVADQPEHVQHSLTSRARFENAASGLAVDAQASISQQALSAFGVQRASGTARPPTAGTENQRELFSANLSPKWTARVAGLALLQASHQWTSTNTRNSTLGDANAQLSSVALSSLSLGRLTLGARASRQRTQPKLSRRSAVDSASATIGWQPDIDWRISGNVGRERTDLRSVQAESGTIYGLGVTWVPTPRTVVDVGADRRVFADTHRLTITHRLPRATISLSESRNLSEPGVLGSIGARTHYDLLFAQLASAEPDPLKRDLLVRQQLLVLGLDPNGIASNGTISQRAALTQLTALSTTVQTQRSTWTLAASQSRSTSFSPTLDGFDDFARSRLIRLRSLSLTGSYRLTPVSSASASWSLQRNEGDTAALRTELQSLVFTWSTRLARNQQLSLNARHTEFDSPLQPYDENAVVLSYQIQF